MHRQFRRTCALVTRDLVLDAAGVMTWPENPKSGVTGGGSQASAQGQAGLVASSLDILTLIKALTALCQLILHVS